jgi:hypothetical protein
LKMLFRQRDLLLLNSTAWKRKLKRKLNLW